MINLDDLKGFILAILAVPLAATAMALGLVLVMALFASPFLGLLWIFERFTQ